jgi:cardiolipin synthase (CMP-forming)
VRSVRSVTGIANLVTGSRVVLALPAFWFAQRVDSFGWLALVVLVAGVSDLVDGWVARRFDRPTRFGAALDPVADGFFFGAVALGLAVGGAYPFWLAWLVVLRYLLPVLVGAVLVLLGRLPSLRHTFFGQLSTALIAVLLGGVALLRGVGLPADGLVLVADVVLPLATLLAWLELARTAWRLTRPPAP